MRYEDATQSGSFQDQGPIARDDADQLAAGDRGPATGNLISGEGTETGAAGADSGSNPRVTAIAGAGGQDATFAGGQLRVEGEHGALSVTARGDYAYRPKADVPENSRDSFTYTLRDATGAESQARLTIEIGRTQAVVAADAQRILPGPDGVVVLPAGVELSDIRIVGRDLLVMLPDGSQMVIVDGAVFVPQLVINDIEVPSTNLAALLIEQEPRPASGVPQSGGGNFATEVRPLDPGALLGDLLPPTNLDYTPPEFRDVALDEDLRPQVGLNPVVQVDDDVRAGGNPGGIGDDADGVNVSGILSGSGGDGPLVFALSTAGAPAGFAFVAGVDGSLLVQQNGVTVLTVTLDASSGAYRVTQNAPIQHPAGGDENNVLFSFGYTVTDRDGDTASGSFTVNVDDDTPVIDVTAGADAGVILATDDADTRGPASDAVSSSANFGGIFSLPVSSAGADGLASGGTLNFALGTPGGASGLTQGGVSINLYLVGGKVVGSTATTAGAVSTANIVFDVSVSSIGVVTLTQFSQIDHFNADPSPTGAPFDDQLIALADGLVTLTASASISDRDGDSASDSVSVQIGANLRFSDDGPSLSNVAASGAFVGQEIAAGSPAGFPKGWLSNGPVVTATQVFGADGPATTGSVSYGLQLTGGGATPLRTAIGDLPISLVQTSATVLTGTYVEGGVTKTAFTISIGANGVVTFTQNVPLEHLVDGSDHRDLLSLDGLVNASITLRDFDGDTATGSVAIGQNIQIMDDGPRVTVTNQSDAAVQFVLDDADTIGAATDSASANLSGLFAVAFQGGADGTAATSVTYSLSGASGNTGLTAGGLPITLVNMPGGRVIGSTAGSGAITEANTIFEVTVDPATGVVTVRQFSAIDHPSANDPSPGGAPFADQSVSLPDNLLTLNIRATITDNDGDEAFTNSSIGIGANIRFTDDGPVARPDRDEVAAGQFGPETGNVLTGAGTTSGATGADSGGADGLARVVAVQGAGGTNASFDGNGNLVIAGQHGTLSIKADGSYSYVRNSGALGGASDTFAYTLRDGDGDTSTAELVVTIGNSPALLDIPPAGGATTTVSEAGLPPRGGEPAGSGEIADNNPGNNSDGSEAVSGSFTFEAKDGFGSLTIGGVALTAASTFPIFISSPGVPGTLQVTGIFYNPATGLGTVQYSFLLGDNLSGDQAVNGGAVDVGFPVVVSDTDGDSSSGTLTIRVLDDRAVAKADTDSLASGTFGPESGNVITGAGTGSGEGGRDVLGADGASIVAVSGFGGSNSVFDADGSLVVNGQYGVLTIKADGSYSYTRNAGTPGGVSDVFNYTLRDGDGDEATTTLTIGIGNDGVVIHIPPAGGATTSVHEAALGARGSEPEGSCEAAAAGSNGDPRETVSGSIGFTAADGLGSISLGGQLLAGNYPQTVVSNATGTLVVTGVSFNAATGVGSIAYSYTLFDNTDAASAPPSFGLIVTDSDGDRTQGNLVIAIVDDAPIARADTDSVAEGASTGGNVLLGSGTDSGVAGSDTLGADGAVVVGVRAGGDTATPAGNQVGMQIAGLYGTLTLNADGSYTYVSSPNSVTSSQPDVFTYTIRDGDGDLSTTTLTITVNNVLLTPNVEVATVNEAALDLVRDGSDLAAGTVTGSNPESQSETASGQLSVPGAVEFAIVGPTTGSRGIILLDPETGAYTYTLTSPASTSPAVNDGTAVGGSETFTYVAKDANGNSVTGTIRIDIVDDVPTAKNDSDVVTEGLGNVADGNVLTGSGGSDANGSDGVADQAGADGGATVIGARTGSEQDSGSFAAVPAGSAGLVIAGTYGDLLIRADGSYSYTLKVASVPVGVTGESFTYQMRDGDGDLDLAELTIAFVQDTNVPTVVGATGTVFEDGLADGSQHGPNSETLTGSFEVGIGQEMAVVTVGGVQPAVGKTIDTGEGLLTITGTSVANGVITFAYSYTLKAPLPHNGSGEVNPILDTITIAVTDATGDSASGAITISIVDDVPTAAFDTDMVAAASFGPETGNVITGAGTTSGAAGADTLGADGATVVGIKAGSDPAAFTGNTGAVVQGLYGKLTLQADGSYSYVRDAGTPGGVTDRFSYTLRDGDGDTAVAELAILIGDAPVTVTVPPAGSAGTIVFERGLPERGSEPAGSGELGDGNGTNNSDPSELTSGTITFVAKDGLGSISLGGVALDLGATGPQTITDTVGQRLVVTGISYDPATGAGTISYEYLLKDNATVDPSVVSFEVLVTDRDGDVKGGNLVIAIVDDVPTARNDLVEQTTENAAITFGVFGNDTFGADGVDIDNNPAARVSFTQPAQGSVSYNAATGLFTFVAAPGQAGETSFTYTIEDEDGDRSTATVTLKLVGDSTPQVSDAVARIDDDGLSGGNAFGTGDIDANVGDLGSSSEAVFAGRIAVDFGGDKAGSAISFANLHNTSGTLGVEAVTYSWNATTNVLTANSARGSVFNVSINPATGDYVVTLLQPVLHAAGNAETSTFVNLNYLASDGDGDQNATGKLTVEFNDDTPRAFTATALTFVNSGSFDNLAAALPLNVTTAAGADGIGSLVFSDDNLADNVLRTSTGTVITSGGERVILSGWETGVLVGTTETTGQKVFTVTLNPAANSYTVDFDRKLDDGSGVDLSGAGFAESGNRAFNFIDVAGTTQDLLFSGFNLRQNGSIEIGTVNTANGRFGVNNQSMQDGDTLRIDFVNSPTVTSSANNSYNYPVSGANAGHYNVDNFTFGIVQLNGSTANGSIEVWVRVFDADDVDPAGTLTAAHFNELADDPQIAISSIRINGELVNLSTLTTDGQGGYLLTGLRLGDKVTVGRVGGYDRIEISNAQGPAGSSLVGEDFDIGNLGFDRIATGNNLIFDFDLKLTDRDGDQLIVPNAIVLTSTPVGSQALAASSAPATSLSTLSTSSMAVDGVTEGSELRTSSANTNLALMAGLAAGFASMPAAAAPEDSLARQSKAETPGNSFQARMPQALDNGRDGIAEGQEPRLETGPMAEAISDNGPFQRFGGVEEVALADEPAATGQANLSELDGGTQQDLAEVATSHLFAGGEIILPSADQMAAFANNGGGEGLGQVPGDALLGSVLVDALAGGGSGLDLDRVIDAAVAQAGPAQRHQVETGAIDVGSDAPDALASPLHAAVPGWDGSDFSPLFMASAMAMEQQALHADAIQPIANG